MYSRSQRARLRQFIAELAERLSRREAAFVSVEQAAELLGVARATAYRAVSRGEIPAIRVGTRWRVPIRGLAELVVAGQADTAGLLEAE